MCVCPALKRGRAPGKVKSFVFAQLRGRAKSVVRCPGDPLGGDNLWARGIDESGSGAALVGRKCTASDMERSICIAGSLDAADDPRER